MRPSETLAGSGISGLDEVLGGGFPRAQLYLIHGSSGAGKTTLGLQFLIEGARRGEKVLYIGSSETEAELHRIAQSHGWSLEGVLLRHRSIPDPGQEQTMLHPAELELPRTMESMLEEVQQAQPDRLVIDSLAEIRVLARDELWYRRQLMTLKHHFSGSDCTVLLIEIPHEKRQTLNSIVAGVIDLEQVSPLYGPDRRRLRVVKVRGLEFDSGYHDYKIGKGGIQAFPRLIAAHHRRHVNLEQFSTGSSEMDAMLDGGLGRGTSHLLLGPSGTGKSVAGTQFIVAAAERGERSAMYLFDERVQTLFHRAEGVGLPLARHVEEGTIQIRQVDPAELTCGEFSHVVRTAVEEDGIQVLFLDSLNGYAYSMPEERLLGVYLHELSSYLNQQVVTPIFTATQHGLLNERLGQSFDVSYIADTVLLFRHFEFAGQVRKAVSVYKSRSANHETTIREMRIGPAGVQIGEPLRQFQGILAGVPSYIGDKLNGHGQDGHSASG